MELKSVAVFCGSKQGNNSLFAEHAKTLGYLLAANSISLVYGGGNNGLMGVVANAVLEKGGRVLGIIPQLLTGWEKQHDGITELIVVENMHVRKRMLYEKADAAIILPGGFGTLDELFEMLTWNQLSIHDKQVFILNSSGFYDAMLLHMQKMQEEGFLYNPLEKTITILAKPEDMFV